MLKALSSSHDSFLLCVFGFPYKHVILHLKPKSCSIIIASIKLQEYPIISKSTSLFHNKAKPPPLPFQGTISPLINFIFSITLSIVFFLNLVSDRKTILGSHHWTNSPNTRTDRRFPSPRQFQPKAIIAPGGAT